MNTKSRISNAIYGLAVADAVGNPFEFISDIIPQKVVEYANLAEKLIISDDSQMTLFGFEALHRIDHSNLLESTVKEFSASYVDWFATQNPIQEYQSNSELLTFDVMHDRQAPGYTCLSACGSLLGCTPVVNDSKGCGAVMRLLPLVQLYIEYPDYDAVSRAAMRVSDITHKHHENIYATSAYMKFAISALKDTKFPVDPRFLEIESIDKIGSGWTALECVNMAIWANLKATSFDHLLQLSIAHNGDSDSVGAVAGSLWGLSGKSVPIKYIEKLNALEPINYIVAHL
jgi:ADP-ribosylglycohydrolase